MIVHASILFWQQQTIPFFGVRYSQNWHDYSVDNMACMNLTTPERLN